MFAAFRRPAPPAACRYDLADGTQAVVRRVRAEDEERLRTGYILLSEHSRRLRYFGQPSEMPLQFLGELDENDHVAWGALDLAAPDGLFMGVGRYVRVAANADAAEVAITVLDPYQSRGVGILLHACLHRCAWARGVRRFLYDVSEDNERFIHHLRELGAPRLGGGPRGAAGDAGVLPRVQGAAHQRGGASAGAGHGRPGAGSGGNRMRYRISSAAGSAMAAV